MSEYLDKLKKYRQNSKTVFSISHVSKMIDYIEELEQSGVGKQAYLKLVKDGKNEALDNLAEKIMAKKLSTISNTIENKIHCLTINNNIDDILELIASMREE